MKKFFKDIGQDIRKGQNLDIYITVLLAFVIAILGIFSIADQSIISAAVLATLALVSTSLLVNRRENEQTQEVINKLDTHDLPEKFLSNDFNRVEFANALSQARQSYILGLSLSTTIPFLRENIKQGLRNGLDLRVIFVKPSSISGDMAILASGVHDADEFNQAVKSNIYRLQRLAAQETTGKLSIRLLDNYLPAFNILAIDPNLPTGRMIVRIVAFREAFPTFELTRAKDNKWFDFFIQQFEKIWEKGHEPEIIEQNEVNQSKNAA